MVEKQRLDFSQVELEIQRELAYRRKVPCPEKEVPTPLTRSPSFQDWSNNDSASASMHQEPIRFPLELPRLPSPMGLVSIKEEPYTTETSSLEIPTSAFNDWVRAAPVIPERKTHPPPTQETEKFYFQPRSPHNIQKPNFHPTKPPHSGLKRKAPENNQQPFSPSCPISKSVENLVCELCRASCSSARVMQQHLNGRPHKAKIEWARLKRSSNGGGRSTKLMCNVCEIWCCDKDALAMHFKGQKHKAKLLEAEICKRNGVGSIDKKPVMCQLCGVSSMNADLFAMHLKGRQHLAKQQELKGRGLC